MHTKSDGFSAYCVPGPGACQHEGIRIKGARAGNVPQRQLLPGCAHGQHCSCHGWGLLIHRSSTPLSQGGMAQGSKNDQKSSPVQGREGMVLVEDPAWPLGSQQPWHSHSTKAHPWAVLLCSLASCPACGSAVKARYVVLALMFVPWH